MELVRSVSGVRGIVGQGLTPRVASAHARAFARQLGGGTVAIGRDARPSGPDLLAPVARGLAAGGCRAVDLGLSATPAVQVAVEEMRAAGGIVLTASHNPAPWNGLKFIGPDGTFLGPERVTRLFEEADRVLGAETSDDGPVAPALASEGRAVEWHVGRALRLPAPSREALGAAKLRVVVDGCRSVGGPSTVRALSEAGVEVIEHDCEPDGRFTRGLEPVPENLGELGRRVRESRASFGVAHDPDGDRAALVDELGKPLGEELTLAIAVQVMLSIRPGPVVVNASSSRVSEDLAARFGVPFHRARVGEIHVVERMRAVGAVVGGEGNGGVIVPAAHYGRDGTVAALLAVRYRLDSGAPLSAARVAFPRYFMVKEKVEGVEWSSVREGLARRFADARADDSDGWRFSWDREWLHVRPSGTEPVVRIISEAPSPERAAELAGRARSALGEAARPPARAHPGAGQGTAAARPRDRR